MALALILFNSMEKAGVTPNEIRVYIQQWHAVELLTKYSMLACYWIVNEVRYAACCWIVNHRYSTDCWKASGFLTRYGVCWMLLNCYRAYGWGRTSFGALAGGDTLLLRSELLSYTATNKIGAPFERGGVRSPTETLKPISSLPDRNLRCFLLPSTSAHSWRQLWIFHQPEYLARSTLC